MCLMLAVDVDQAQDKQRVFPACIRPRTLAVLYLSPASVSQAQCPWYRPVDGDSREAHKDKVKHVQQRDVAREVGAVEADDGQEHRAISGHWVSQRAHLWHKRRRCVYKGLEVSEVVITDDGRMKSKQDVCTLISCLQPHEHQY